MAEIELPNPEELHEHRAKAFTRTIALTTAIFAVLLAITSLGGNNAMKEMLLAQQQSSDQWAFYQSKAMREHLDTTNIARLETELFDRGPQMRSAVRMRYDNLLKDLKMEQERYTEEKKKIEETARHLESERDRFFKKDPYFDYAEVLLQISIVMASIAILAASRPVFYLAICSASLGAILMLNGFFLVVNVPFLH